jgi:alpha-glucosidase
MRDAHGRMKAVLFAALRGNIIVYQGEELGLTQVDIPFELLQDPEAIANWPLTLSRDGARTPLPWQAEGAMGGFTEGETPGSRWARKTSPARSTGKRPTRPRSCR